MGNVRVTGRDGKSYPGTAGDPERVRDAVHQLHCAEGMSVRGTQREMARRYGIERSVGRIHAALTDSCCDRCEGSGVQGR